MAKTKVTTQSQSDCRAHAVPDPASPVANLQKVAKPGAQPSPSTIGRGKSPAPSRNPKHAAEGAALKVELGSSDKVAADTARYEKLAREHGADLSEEGFNEALRRVGKPKA